MDSDVSFVFNFWSYVRLVPFRVNMSKKILLLPCAKNTDIAIVSMTRYF